MTKDFNPNRTVSLSKFSFFKLLHLLIRSYQVPVLLICPLALCHFLKFKVFIKLRAYNHESKQEAQIDITSPWLTPWLTPKGDQSGRSLSKFVDP